MVDEASNNAEHPYEVKLLLIGKGQVGKTSLSKSLRSPRHKLAVEQPTKGIDIQSWVVSKRESGLKRDLRIQIWDLGGDDIYCNLHKLFFTKHTLYLLITESSLEHEEQYLYDWLKVIGSLSSNGSVIVVRNKKEQSKKILRMSDLEEYFRMIDFEIYKTNCNPDYTLAIKELRTAIIRLLGQITLKIEYEVPGIWAILQAMQLKFQELRTSGHNYIEFDHYLDLCAQNGINTEFAHVLAEFFHDLGVFLHFKNDLALHDTIFLNYEWLTHAIYKVLNDEKIRARYGYFDDADLIKIWHDESHRKKRSQLLALLKHDKFGICYKLLNGRGFLAPQLLPNNEPAIEWDKTQNTFRLEYRYHFIPNGILDHFIVEHYGDIHKQTHWRNGVVLKYQETMALVQVSHLKLSIVLAGENKRGLLDIICKTLDDIQDKFDGLLIGKFVPCNCIDCRNNTNPEYFIYDELRSLLRQGHREVICKRKPHHKVNIFTLIDDSFPSDSDAKTKDDPQLKSGPTYNNINNIQGNATIAAFGDSTQNLTIGGDQVGGDKVGGDKLAGDKVDGDKLMGEHVGTPLGAAAENADVGGPDPALTVAAVWIDRAVYLALAALLLALVAYLGNQVAGYVVLLVFIAGILVVGGVGALHLRQEENLRVQGWRALLAGVYRRCWEACMALIKT